MSSPESHPMPPPPRQGSGGKCLIGCGIIAIILIAFCAGLGWYLYNNAQRIAITAAAELLRTPLVESIEDSDLRDEDKKAIVQQIDRVVEEAKAGRIDGTKFEKIIKNLGETPLVQVGFAYYFEANYVKPSGLSEEKKDQAKLTLERVARGVFEKKIDPDELQSAVNTISEPGPNGKQKLKKHITDEELNEFLSDLKQVADQAEIPEEPFKVDIGAEIKKAVDDALGESSQ